MEDAPLEGCDDDMDLELPPMQSLTRKTVSNIFQIFEETKVDDEDDLDGELGVLTMQRSRTLHFTPQSLLSEQSSLPPANLAQMNQGVQGEILKILQEEIYPNHHKGGGIRSSG